MIPQKTNKKFDTFLRVVADDFDRLRRCDVYRLIEMSSSKSELKRLSAYILARRPDLETEVETCMEEIMQSF